MASRPRRRAIKQKRKQAEASPLQITQKWVVKKKEPVSTSINMADRADSSSTHQRRPWTRNVTRAQAQWLGTPIQFRNLNEVQVKSNDSDEDSFVQSARGILALEPCRHCIPTSTRCSWQTTVSATSILTKAPTFLIW